LRCSRHVTQPEDDRAKEQLKMVGQGFTILLYMFAFATGSMTLALSVVFHIREEYEWTKYFILFHASLLATMVLQVLKVFANVFFSETAALVTSYVIEGMLTANVGFLILFVPYFTAWITKEPWRAYHTVTFAILGTFYVALAVLEIIFRSVWLLQSGMMAIFIGTLFYSIFAIIVNLKRIQNSDVKTVSRSIIILSFVMIPLLLISFIYPSMRYFTYPFYFMSFSIIILVFLFIYFSRMVPTVVKKELIFERGQLFNISRREFSVIELIQEGLTNKEIADQLDISVNTVNNHIANIFGKTKVRSRIDLLNLLAKEEWV
jgi:DNA-binding CsgD family transcriptional regulator